MKSALNDKKKLRPSAWIGIVIMVGWAITMAVLLKDYSGAGDVVAPDSGQQLFGSVLPADKWQDIDEWMKLVHVDQESGRVSPLGASHTSIRRAKDGTSTSAFLAHFALSAKITPLMPAGHVSGMAMLDKDGNLTSFTAKGNIAGFSLATQGLIDKDKLYVTIAKPNETSRFIKSLKQKVTFGEVLRPSIARHLKLEPGERMSSPIIDPMTGTSRGKIVMIVEKSEQIHLNNQSIAAYRIKSKVGDVETLMWVDEKGRTLRRNLVNSLRMDRTDAESALKIAPDLDQMPTQAPIRIEDFQGIAVDAQTKNPDELNGTAGLLDLILK